LEKKRKKRRRVLLVSNNHMFDVFTIPKGTAGRR